MALSTMQCRAGTAATTTTTTTRRVGAAAAASPHHSARPQRAGVVVRSGQFFNESFNEVLQGALERNRDEQDAIDRASAAARRGGGGGGYGGGGGDALADSAGAGPLLQILATALGQSRATLERLQAEEAEIEALIQQERKQVERLEYVLEKVHKDWAYYTSIERRFQEMSR